MQIVISDESGPTAKVGLVGKLDNAGAAVIALPLATLASEKTALIVDMSGVTFLASVGIHHLISASKTLGRRGGKLVLVNPKEMVKEVLVICGIADSAPIVSTESEAYALVG